MRQCGCWAWSTSRRCQRQMPTAMGTAMGMATARSSRCAVLLPTQKCHAFRMCSISFYLRDDVGRLTELPPLCSMRTPSWTSGQGSGSPIGRGFLRSVSSHVSNELLYWQASLLWGPHMRPRLLILDVLAMRRHVRADFRCGVGLHPAEWADAAGRGVPAACSSVPTSPLFPHKPVIVNQPMQSANVHGVCKLLGQSETYVSYLCTCAGAAAAYDGAQLAAGRRRGAAVRDGAAAALAARPPGHGLALLRAQPVLRTWRPRVRPPALHPDVHAERPFDPPGWVCHKEEDQHAECPDGCMSCFPVFIDLQRRYLYLQAGLRHAASAPRERPHHVQQK